MFMQAGSYFLIVVLVVLVKPSGFVAQGTKGFTYQGHLGVVRSKFCTEDCAGFSG